MNNISYRIGIDCRLWNETGVGRYIRNLIWELEKIDNKNSYFLFFKKNEYDNVFIESTNFIKVLADIRWHSVEEQVVFPKILNEQNLDLMHFPYFSVPVFYKKPFVVTIHDLIINHYPTGKASTRSPFLYWTKHFGYSMVLKSAVVRAKGILVPSNATKKEIITHYKTKSNKIAVTPEGVDEKILSALSEGIKKRFIDDPYFLYVGNGYPHKNLERLLEAFKELLDQTKEPVKLVLVGKQDFFYARHKEYAKKLNITQNVLFYEKVSDGGLASLYSHALALVAPSLMEGFGLPVLEAMAAKCLIIASDIDAFREICQDMALYINPFDIHAMTDVLSRVLQNKVSDAKQRKEKLAQRVRDFSWATMARQTLETYESCIGL